MPLDGTITDGGDLTHCYSVEFGSEVKMSKHEIIEAVEKVTIYNRVERVNV